MSRSVSGANRAAQLNMLNNLGQDQFDFDIVNTNSNPLEEAVGNFISRVKENIQKSNAVVTGKMEDIKMRVDGNKVQVIANPWLLYQDRGVNGSVKKLYNTPHSYSDKMPPVDVFISWIKEKNIQLRNTASVRGKESEFKELDDDTKIERAAWGMAKKVFKEGFKPRKFFSNEIPQLIDDVKKIAPQFAVQQIKQLINVKPEARRVIL